MSLVGLDHVVASLGIDFIEHGDHLVAVLDLPCALIHQRLSTIEGSLSFIVNTIDLADVFGVVAQVGNGIGLTLLNGDVQETVASGKPVVEAKHGR